MGGSADGRGALSVTDEPADDRPTICPRAAIGKTATSAMPNVQTRLLRMLYSFDNSGMAWL
jgi:hypothetical protein